MEGVGSKERGRREEDNSEAYQKYTEKIRERGQTEKSCTYEKLSTCHI